MRRGAIKVVVLLMLLIVAGAIVNVAVAWGCAAWVIGERVNILLRHNDGRYFHGTMSCGFGATRINLLDVFESVLPEDIKTRREIKELPAWSRKHDELGCEDARGWPLRSMWYEVHRGWFSYPVDAAYDIALPPRASTRYALDAVRALPVTPIWPGFAINTIFYAGLLWVAFFAPGKVKRTLRRRRGLCHACAYDLRASASPVCTECGAAVAAAHSEGATECSHG